MPPKNHESARLPDVFDSSLSPVSPARGLGRLLEHDPRVLHDLASCNANDLDVDRGPCPCVLSMIAERWLDGPAVPRPALTDEEGSALPTSLPPVVDAHVHLFPERVFEAIWRWFEAYGWPIRYKLDAPSVASFLLSRGVSRIVGLAYSHKPGMARFLNQFMAELAKSEPRIVGLATVLPGEPDAVAVLDEAFDAGLRGVKLHCHVQRFAPDAAETNEIYALCAARKLPIVMHAGREPASPHYQVDTHTICAADRVERVLKDHPTLALCIPHFGADEFDAYADLLERFDNLWLDTTMVLADYFPAQSAARLVHVRPSRVLFGTDFPNIPYAWDREIKQLTKLGLSDDHLARVLAGSASELFGLA